MTLEITQPRQLIVEGASDEMLFEALIQHIGLVGIQTQNLEGIANLGPYLRTLVQNPGFRDEVIALGIVRDADSNASDAFSSVRDALVDVGLTAPTEPLQLVGDTPKVAVLVVPHGQDSGTIEDVCLASAADDPAMSCVNAYFECLEHHSVDPPNSLSKARVQAFLSSRRQPYLLLGGAARERHWNFDHPAFDPLKHLLQML